MSPDGHGNLSEVWWEKHRPTSLEEMALTDEHRAELQHYLDQGAVPHLLLAGPAGTGKTTLAQVLIDALGCASLTLNASDERGIDTIRGSVKNFARRSVVPGSISALTSGQPGLKIILLDEADALTPAAQTALRRIIEQRAATTRFILTANYLDEIIDPIQSRLRHMDLKVVPTEEKARVLRRILEAEDAEAEAGAVEELAQEGIDLRQIIDKAQRSVIRYGRVVVTSVQGREAEQRIRKTVEAVERLQADHPEGVPQSALADELDLTPGAITTRVRQAKQAGYLEDHGGEVGRSAQLVVTEKWTAGDR